MSVESPHVDAGPYVVGEKPAPITYAFKDSAGGVLTLTGFTVKLVIKERDGTPTTLNASLIDGPNGVVGYTWVGTEFTTPGHWMMEFWVGNTVQRFCSLLIVFDVRTSLGVVPAI